jgi:hypothetical protein
VSCLTTCRGRSPTTFIDKLENFVTGRRAIVTVLEAEVMLVEGHQVVFEECFENINASHMVTRLSNNIDHLFWLQGPFNHYRR